MFAYRSSFFFLVRRRAAPPRATPLPRWARRASIRQLAHGAWCSAAGDASVLPPRAFRGKKFIVGGEREKEIEIQRLVSVLKTSKGNTRAAAWSPNNPSIFPTVVVTLLAKMNISALTASCRFGRDISQWKLEIFSRTGKSELVANWHDVYYIELNFISR